MPPIDPKGESAERGFVDAHNGVRRDDAVEVREPNTREQRNHQQGMGGCYI
jgi:hypothetical protein